MGLMTLTCNSGGMPMGLIDVRDAVGHLARAQVEDSNAWYALYSDESRPYRSEELTIPTPLVIATTKPTPNYLELDEADTHKVTRRVLFARDGWECQYCGRKANPRSAFKELTVDHVKPAHLFESRAAATTWDNVVAACAPCNHRKGGRLPMEVHMPDGTAMLPKTTPKTPHFVQLRFAGRLNELQRSYVNDYFFGSSSSEVPI